MSEWKPRREPEPVGKITQMITANGGMLYVLTESGEMWHEVTDKRQSAHSMGDPRLPKFCWERLDGPTEKDRPAGEPPDPSECPGCGKEGEPPAEPPDVPHCTYCWRPAGAVGPEAKPRPPAPLPNGYRVECRGDQHWRAIGPDGWESGVAREMEQAEKWCVNRARSNPRGGRT